MMGWMALPPAHAEEPEGESDGRPLIEEALRLFLEGMMREMEPALEDLGRMADRAQPALREFMREMGPALAELLAEIEDLSAYHPPEMLPNGDIIIRRKTPEEEPEHGEDSETAPADEIEI